nr:hypothetical protein GCM10020092_062290 [Actinoplanes digitatis]
MVRELLVDHPTYAQVAYGSVVVLTVVFAPTGLAGLPRRIRAAVGRRGAVAGRLGPFQPYERGDAPPADAPAVLRADDVHMSFRGLKALDGVTLTVRQGEIRGIVGPNGSGKTTLFNVISGLYRPTGGRVEFGGRDVTGLPPYRLARARHLPHLPEPAALRRPHRPGEHPGRAGPQPHRRRLALPAAPAERGARRPPAAGAGRRGARPVRPDRLRRAAAALPAVRHPAAGRDR